LACIDKREEALFKYEAEHIESEMTSFDKLYTDLWKEEEWDRDFYERRRLFVHFLTLHGYSENESWQVFQNLVYFLNE
jgi:hypothetical protein